MRRANPPLSASRRCRRLALGLAGAALLASGCARVGAPEPPLKHLPPAPAPVTAAQEAAVLVVSCRLPAANTDGSGIKGYRRLEVLGVLAPPGAALDALPAALPVVADWNETTLAAQLRERRFEARLNLAGRFGGSEGTVAVGMPKKGTKIDSCGPRSMSGSRYSIWPSRSARTVRPRIAGFSPGTSPPPVRMPIVPLVVLKFAMRHSPCRPPSGGAQ